MLLSALAIAVFPEPGSPVSQSVQPFSGTSSSGTIEDTIYEIPDHRVFYFFWDFVVFDNGF
jgi:hypothetical protein